MKLLPVAMEAHCSRKTLALMTFLTRPLLMVGGDRSTTLCWLVHGVPDTPEPHVEGLGKFLPEGSGILVQWGIGE